MPFPDAADTENESHTARGYSGLIGMDHEAGVAQGRTFDGVLAGEYRAYQQHSFVGDLGVRIEPIGPG